MLADHYGQLLTAYVDGELSERRRQQVMRLLEKSHSARALLRQLQDNADRLHNLPRHAVKPGFAAEVLTKIESAAAKVEVESQQPGVGAAQPASAAPAVRTSRPVPAWLGLAAAAAILLAVTAASYLFFSTRLGTTGPEPDRGMVLANLDPEIFRDRLGQELKQGSGIQLALACRDNVEAIAHLNHALEKSGIKLLLAPETRAKIQKDPTREVLVFAENFGPEELGSVLQDLAGQVNAAKEFDTVQVHALTDQDRKQVAGLLGLKKLDNPADIDWGNIIQAPNGKWPGRKPPATIAKVAPKKERLAVVLLGGAGQGTSAAIQRFLSNRASPRPGTFPMVLVLRPASA